MTDADQELLRNGVGAVEGLRDVVFVIGGDAVSYLQGQVSQDVEALAVGATAPSLILDPQGKLVAWFRVTRRGENDFLLDVEHGFGEALLARLARFKLRVAAELELATWPMVALRGPGSPLPAEAPAQISAAVDWAGLPGLDLVGPDVGVPDGVALCSHEAFDAVRIEAGVPAMGRELIEGSIPAESGVVDASVSFTKGCYTGQELVARIDSRGNNTPRRLRGLILDGDAVPDAGAAVLVDGAEVGHVTSAAWSSALAAVVALGHVRRAVEPPASAMIQSADASTAAQVVELPLLAASGRVS